MAQLAVGLRTRPKVSGDAKVSGSAQVFGGNWASSPLHIVGRNHSLTNCSPKHIQIGCERHSFDVWKICYEHYGQKNGYSPEQIAEYKLLIDLIVKIGR